LSEEIIMMHDREIRIRLSNIQMAVSQAAQALSAERHLTGELRDTIQKLDRRSDDISEMLVSEDYANVPKLVDDMEMLGARARRVCASERMQVTPEMKAAVNFMHRELFDFKQHLH
jgi:CCR4-NOT transcriptional regulation complex NOT5 subunit